MNNKGPKMEPCGTPVAKWVRVETCHRNQPIVSYSSSYWRTIEEKYLKYHKILTSSVELSGQGIKCLG